MVRVVLKVERDDLKKLQNQVVNNSSVIEKMKDDFFSKCHPRFRYITVLCGSCPMTNTEVTLIT
jgi:hypothetical protein